MDRKKLHAEILDFLTERVSWEEKQRVWYQMRHDGLGRKNPPFPGAADLHYALSDTQIGQFKPFYYKQIFGNELIATFVPTNKGQTELARIAEQWFNFQLCYKSNLRRESQIFSDKMLQSGQSVCKVLWDAEKNQVMFDAIDPMSIIVPSYARGIQDVDKLVHVIKLSVDAYKRNKHYNQDPAFIKAITGKYYESSNSDKSQLEQLKKIREGFSTSCSDNQIIIWETYVREAVLDEDDKEVEDDEGNVKYQWRIYTYSPKRIEEDIKPDFVLDYNHGKLPFVQFEFEIKEKSFFSSRGIVETVAMEETYLSKLMNEKADAITLCNRPVYSSVGQPIPNTENLRMNPGSILPVELKAIIHPQPPIDYDNEMMSIRQNAERRVGTPDFGINNNQPAMGSRTATEVSAITQLSSIVVDLRASIFRDSLTELYNQAWSLLLQYKKNDFQFYYQEEMMEAEPKALQDIYFIQPSGAVDSYNKSLQMQKADFMLKSFWGNPYIRQDQLVRNSLTMIDPRFVPQLFQDPQESQAGQAEDQAQECLLIEQGFPAVVKNIDDHLTHMSTLIHRLEMLTKLGAHLNPLILKLYMNHMNDHLFMFKAQKGKQAPEANQLEQAFKQAMSVFIPRQTQPPQNGVPPQSTPQQTAQQTAQQPQEMMA